MIRLDSRLVLLCLVLGSTLGCPGDDSTNDDGAGGLSSDGSTTEAATNAATSATSVTSAAPTTSESTGAAADCDGSSCAADEYCDWSSNSCGTAGFDTGTCQPRPQGCPADYSPVCGCDGVVHGNECGANGAGADVDASGACEPPAEYFRCGYRFCSLGIEYCQVAVSDVGGVPDGYSCVQPAAPCDPLDCSCLEAEPCFEFSCEATEDGGIEIVCPGG